MRLNSNAKLLLKRQVELILSASGKAGSSGRWPMPVLRTTNEASIHSEPLVAEAFWRRIQTLKQEGRSNLDIGKLFPYPSSLARLTMIFRSRAIWKLPQELQVAMYNDLADILASRYLRSPFCEGGENILLSTTDEKTLRSRISKTSLEIPNELIAQLDGRLWLYSEMLFSRWHNLAHEFHGVYQNGPKLLIKEWHDLKGSGWKVFSTFPHRHITCYEFFEKNTVTLDIHNRLKTTRPFVPTISASYVSIDGRFVGPKYVRSLIDILNPFLVRGSRYLASRTVNDLKKMNGVMEFYAIKPIADALHENWLPPRTLGQSIRRKMLTAKAQATVDQLTYYYSRNTKRNIQMQYDPSIAFK